MPRTDEAGEAPPFVVVGHSIGALASRVFAQTYPDEVVGMVLVDPTHEGARLGYRGELVQVRTLASGRPIPPVAGLQDNAPQLASGDVAEQCRRAAASAAVFGPYLKLPADEQRALLWLLRNPRCHVPGYDYLPEELADLHARRLQKPQPLRCVCRRRRRDRRRTADSRRARRVGEAR